MKKRADSPLFHFQLERALLKLGVAKDLIIWGRIGLHAKAFASPGADVQIFAAFAAKRTKGIAGGIHTLAAASRAFHDSAGRCLIHDSGVCEYSNAKNTAQKLAAQGQAHKVSSNSAFSAALCTRSSSSRRIIRTDTIRRLALISGTKEELRSSRRRSKWKVRPCGRLCW